jgi:hypothetical protein
MVFLTLSSKLNQWLGPFLLKQGLTLRHKLGGGVYRDSRFLDAITLLPLSQKLISIEHYHEGQEAVKDGSEKELSSSELRVRILEGYLRRALVPNDQWRDVTRWQFNQRFLKWARAEYLQAKYGDELRLSLEAFPEIIQSPQLGSRRTSGLTKFLVTGNRKLPSSPKQSLPSSSIVKKALGLTDWTIQKNHRATGADMRRLCKQLDGNLMELYGGAIRFADISPEADVSDLSLPELLELASGHVTQCGSFNALCEHMDAYQLWTQDFVDTLGAYLAKRTGSFSEGQTIVVDVGAGDGLLAQALTDYFEQQQTAGPTVVATDNGSWKIAHQAQVQTMSVEEAMENYAPNDRWQVIVLCSWMPLGEDWSNLFRSSRVDEYILIGECDDGQVTNILVAFLAPFSLSLSHLFFV